MSNLKALISIAKDKNKAKSDRKETIIKKYKELNKKKKLTQEQRLDRIEEILNISYKD